MTEAPLAVVLASGGLDSCVATAVAAVDHRLALLHANYGQRTQERELRAFADLADHFHAAHRLVVDLPGLRQIGGSSLTDPRLPVPDEAPIPGVVPSTYVPFRNGNLLSLAVAWAEVLGAASVFIGVHARDAQYPDCRPEFVHAFNQAVRLGTRPHSGIQVCAPLVELDKAAIVRRGAALTAPFHLTWSCYQRSDLACGCCHSCRLRLQGFREAGTADPLRYAPSRGDGQKP